MTQKDYRMEDADTEIQKRLIELAERACRGEEGKHVFDDWKARPIVDKDVQKLAHS